MQEIIEEIVEKIDIARKDKLTRLLNDCIKVSKDTQTSTYADHDNVLFKLDLFFPGFEKISNDITKDKRLPIGVQALYTIFWALGLEIDQEEAFILYHLRNQGKFRLKEEKLKKDLKGMWGQHKEFALEDQDFSHALKSMMRMGIIDYRKGNLSLKKGVLITYRRERK
ncbi:hypothetical protein [Halobacteriovorax sp. HLS]|uniref:hypothetical protein n=1 Tax=Halobacteriovorax sp. HLS TaxID=2234000 RepID=UPI000FD78987|nr:hypothetical protein [Halobacteriovorax sp. HLS]